jgi:hypothetical protein
MPVHQKFNPISIWKKSHTSTQHLRANHGKFLTSGHVNGLFVREGETQEERLVKSLPAKRDKQRGDIRNETRERFGSLTYVEGVVIVQCLSNSLNT